MNYKAYMRSSQWKEKRHAKLEACNSKCECEGGCTRQATQVHHLHYDTLGNESMDDLQALCPKCHMQKSNVRNFYGRTNYKCCLLEGETAPPEKTLPYSVWNEANFHYLTGDSQRYDKIASELNTDPVIIALLDNLGIMFACGDIAVEDKVTAAIGEFVDIVPAKEAGLDGYCDMAYKIKKEFEEHF